MTSENRQSVDPRAEAPLEDSDYLRAELDGCRARLAALLRQHDVLAEQIGALSHRLDHLAPGAAGLTNPDETGQGSGLSDPPTVTLPLPLDKETAPMNSRRALLTLAHELERRKPWWWSPRWRRR